MVTVDIGSVTMKLSSVFYKPALPLNAFSCSRLDEHGISTLIREKYCCSIDRRNDDVVLGKILQSDFDRLQKVEIMEHKDSARVLPMNVIGKGSIDDNASNCSLRHRRMGHTNQFAYQRMVKNHAHGLKACLKRETTSCEVCVRTKATEQRNHGDLV